MKCSHWLVGYLQYVDYDRDITFSSEYFVHCGIKPSLKAPPPLFREAHPFCKLCKNCNFLRKVITLSQYPFSENRDPVKPPIFQNLVGSISPQQKGVGMHTASLKTGTSENVLLVFIFPYDQKTTTRQKSCTINVFC